MTALQTWVIGNRCASGVPTELGTVHAPGWPGPHHCWHCAAEIERAAQVFAEAVGRGQFTSDGYEPNRSQRELF